MFRGMVSSEALVRQSVRTLDMCEFEEAERPVITQIFGADPAAMAEAARIIEERYHPDGIDINMGCPVHNVVSNFNGAFLMKEPERASAIIRAVKAAITLPLSVKTRLGWSRATDVLEFAKIIEDAGADLIVIHGRTKEQGYSGKADWRRVGEARERVSVPVLVNGDIVDLKTASAALEQSGAAGVLIGRGALGNPWIFRRLAEGLRGENIATDPTLEDRIKIVREHARFQVQHYGDRGLIKLRKHLPWYFKGIPGLRDIRSELVRVEDLEGLNRILEKIQIS